SSYQEVLHCYHQWRHRILVDERGWEELRRPDGLERDQFDTEDAVHLIEMDGGGVIGGSRLISTVRPTLLSEVFPYLVERGEVPRDEAVLDWSRIFVLPSRRVPRKLRNDRDALVQ